MENPYGWPPELQALWLQTLKAVTLNRYPQPDPAQLKIQLAQQFDNGRSVDMICGNGSDELIQLVTLAIAKPGACVLTVSPSFSMYQLIAQMLGLTCHSVPLTENFDLDMPATLAAIEQYDPALIFLAYPNNPTGNLWHKTEIEKIIQSSTGLVVVDEAYGPFTDHSFSDELDNYPNLLLLRTASKLGLAGIRFGWLAGNSEIITALNKLRLPYNINSLTQTTLQFALAHFDVFAAQAQQIRDSRTRLFERLTSLEGVHPYPSEANFILCKLQNKDASEVFNQLLAHKVLIKNMSQQQGLNNCLRITVGTEEENQTCIQALQKALAS
jgi:histidinol-phosphate aminotransferase